MTIWIVDEFNTLVQEAADKYFPEDRVRYDAAINYVPTDDGAYLPVAVIYLQINGTESTDGIYLIDTLPPSMISEEAVDVLVAELALRSKTRRGEIRAALARGEAEQTLGLPKDAEVV